MGVVVTGRKTKLCGRAEVSPPGTAKQREEKQTRPEVKAAGPERRGKEGTLAVEERPRNGEQARVGHPLGRLRRLGAGFVHSRFEKQPRARIAR